jgi:hypothetical protein
MAISIDLPMMDRCDEAVEILVALLRDPNTREEVVKGAAESLSRLASVIVLEAVAVDEGLSGEGRLQAALTLRRLGHPGSASALLELAGADDVAPAVRIQALATLRTRGRKQRIRRILKQLLHSNNADEWIREAAAMRLGDLESL